MLLLAVLALACLCAVALSSLLGLIGGTAIDLNAVLGAAVLILGALSIGVCALGGMEDEQTG